MKSFLKKSAIHFAILAILLFLLQWICDTGLRKSEYENYREWNDAMLGKINAELLIQGSSRAWVHFSPKHLDSAFQINSYNLGIDGYDFLMQDSRLKIYLANNKRPEYIIQVMDITTLPSDA